MQDKSVELKKAILEHLKRENCGFENARPRQEIAAQFDLEDRVFRDLVHEMVCAGHTIGTSPKYGYFYASTALDDAKALAPLKGQLYEIGKRVQGFEYGAARRDDQLKLFDRERLAAARKLSGLDGK